MTAPDTRLPRVLLAAAVALAVTAVVGGSQAGAAPAPVGLGTATSFAVLAGSTVTNTGPTTIDGDVGVSPGTAVTGFPPGTVSNGTIHAADAVALQAQNDLTTAYNDAAGRTPTAPPVTADLGGQTLVAGVYGGATLGLTGTLTLDAQGDPAAVFILQAGSTLTTASASRVLLINGGDPCNVFWQVGSSAVLGTNTTFVGSILALTSVTAETNATVAGRLLARNGAVTLDTNTVTRPSCAVLAPATTTTTTTTTLPATAATDSTTAMTLPTTTTLLPTTTTLPSGTATTATSLPSTGSSPATGTGGRRTTTRPRTALTTSRSGRGGGSSNATGVPDLAVTGPRYLITLTMAGLLALCAGGYLVLASSNDLPIVEPRRSTARS